MSLLFSVLVVLLVYCVNSQSSGCSGTPPAGPGTTNTYTILYGGQERTYIVHIPTGYVNNQAVPLIFGFPGYTISANYFSNYFGMNQHSDQETYLAVTVQGNAITRPNVE